MVFIKQLFPIILILLLNLGPLPSALAAKEPMGQASRLSPEQIERLKAARELRKGVEIRKLAQLIAELAEVPDPEAALRIYEARGQTYAEIIERRKPLSGREKRDLDQFISELAAGKYSEEDHDEFTTEDQDVVAVYLWYSKKIIDSQ